MRRRALAAIVALAALDSGCHSAPAAGTELSPAELARSSRTYNVITREEMVESSLLGTTAYLAVQRLRPSYLIDKTAGAAASIHPLSVSVNGGQLTPVNALISIPVQSIAEIRYLDIGDAAQRFRNRAAGPVILVTLTSQPSP